MQRLSALLERLNQSVAKTQADFKSHSFGITLAGEGVRGIFLDTLASLLNTRKQIKQQLEDGALTIQAIKDEIADLLNKLGSCGAKETSQAPTQETPMGQPSTPAQSVPASLPGYQVGSEQASGLRTTTFTTPQGKITVNLTDDLAAGDTISGTVDAEPEGKTEQERAANMAVLEGYVIEFAGQMTTVGHKTVQSTIPATPTAETSTLRLTQNGQPVASKSIPVATTPPPAPTEITLPTGGQVGHTLELKGPCDGVFSPNDAVKVGGTTLPPVAKGPRKLVVRNTSEAMGPVKIEWHENGWATECSFRNLGIRLSAPLLHLLRDQTTILTAEVLGLAGITEDVPLSLVNTSTTVISMSGGNAQSLMIHPAEVTGEGTYSVQRTLSGIRAGGFGVTGTVTWKNVCTTPVPVRTPVAIVPPPAETTATLQR